MTGGTVFAFATVVDDEGCFAQRTSAPRHDVESHDDQGTDDDHGGQANREAESTKSGMSPFSTK